MTERNVNLSQKIISSLEQKIKRIFSISMYTITYIFILQFRWISLFPLRSERSTILFPSTPENKPTFWVCEIHTLIVIEKSKPYSKRTPSPALFLNICVMSIVLKCLNLWQYMDLSLNPVFSSVSTDFYRYPSKRLTRCIKWIDLWYSYLGEEPVNPARKKYHWLPQIEDKSAKQRNKRTAQERSEGHLIK